MFRPTTNGLRVRALPTELRALSCQVSDGGSCRIQTHDQRIKGRCSLRLGSHLTTLASRHYSGALRAPPTTAVLAQLARPPCRTLRSRCRRAVAVAVEGFASTSELRRAQASPPARANTQRRPIAPAPHAMLARRRWQRCGNGSCVASAGHKPLPPPAHGACRRRAHHHERRRWPTRPSPTARNWSRASRRSTGCGSA